MSGHPAAVVGPLLRPSLRTIRWIPLGAIVALGGWVVWSGAREEGNPAAIALPIATTMLGLWLCLLFEDAASEIAAPSPVPLWLRRAIRITIAAPPVAAAWFAFTWLGPLHGPTPPMAAMVAAVIVVALACAAATTRFVSSTRSGPVAAVALIGFVLVLPILLARVFERPISIDPSRVVLGDPLTYWASTIAVAAAVLVLAHRDPAVRGFRASIRAPSRRPLPPVPAREPH
ncbi:MAG: hypothetical protein WEE66_12950 [Actinomycetota bacterium]